MVEGGWDPESQGMLGNRGTRNKHGRKILELVLLLKSIYDVGCEANCVEEKRNFCY